MRSVNVVRQQPELGDRNLEALLESCPDCRAQPLQPCFPECSSHWK